MNILDIEIYVLVLCVVSLVLIARDIQQTHKQKKKKGKDNGSER